VPVTGVTIHGNGPFARVGLQEDDRSVLMIGSVARANSVEVVEKPREECVVIACASL